MVAYSRAKEALQKLADGDEWEEINPSDQTEGMFTVGRLAGRRVTELQAHDLDGETVFTLYSYILFNDYDSTASENLGKCLEEKAIARAWEVSGHVPQRTLNREELRKKLVAAKDGFFLEREMSGETPSLHEKAELVCEILRDYLDS